MSTGRRGTRSVAAPGTLRRHTLGGTLVLPPETDTPIFLGGAAAALWDEMADPVDLTGVARRLATRYDRPLPDVIAELEPVWLELHDSGALVTAP